MKKVDFLARASKLWASLRMESSRRSTAWMYLSVCFIDDSILCNLIGVATVAKSVLDAIQEGEWNYEPEYEDSDEFDATVAPPGSDEKLKVLAERIQKGLPLWHPKDRHVYGDRPAV